MTTRQRINRWAFAAVAALALGAALAARAAEDDAAALVARLEGGWYGENNATPMGPIPIGLLFERQADGSLRSRASLNRETYFDLWFSQAQDGRWMLHEEAGMEGLGVQGYSLAPAGPTEGGGWRWVYEPDPDFLLVDVAASAEHMVVDVRLRGERHVLFELDRMAPEALPELRRQEVVQACQLPEEGLSVADVMAAVGAPTGPSESEGDEEIADARRGVAERPADGRAHLELARALGSAIDANPANGPRYAQPMLTALQTAIELEPDLVEAYHWLAGYYLEAPPIAGGSLERAEETARELARLDPEGAEGLLRRIAARRDGR